MARVRRDHAGQRQDRTIPPSTTCVQAKAIIGSRTRRRSRITALSINTTDDCGAMWAVPFLASAGHKDQSSCVLGLLRSQLGSTPYGWGQRQWHHSHEHHRSVANTLYFMRDSVTPAIRRTIISYGSAPVFHSLSDALFLVPAFPGCHSCHAPIVAKRGELSGPCGFCFRFISRRKCLAYTFLYATKREGNGLAGGFRRARTHIAQLLAGCGVTQLKT